VIVIIGWREDPSLDNFIVVVGEIKGKRFRKFS
jgi:hypothetical protein